MWALKRICIACPLTASLPPQEVERQYKEGSSKAAIVAALKAAGPAGLTIAGVIETAASLGVKSFEDKQKPALQSALSSDPNFVRLGKGIYSLHCLHPGLVVMARPTAPKKRKLTEHFEGAGAGEGEPAAKAAKPRGAAEEAAAAPPAAPVEEEVDSITKVCVYAPCCLGLPLVWRWGRHRYSEGSHRSAPSCLDFWSFKC